MSACTGRCESCPFACHADHENDEAFSGDLWDDGEMWRQVADFIHETAVRMIVPPMMIPETP